MLHNVDALVVHLLFKGHLCSELFTMAIPFDQGHPQLVDLFKAFVAVLVAHQ